MSTVEQRRTAPRNRTWTLFGHSAGAETREGTDDAILDAGLFEQELYRQRARADRTESGFVLLSFSLSRERSNGRPASSYAKLLAEIVRRRARMSDVVGWDGTETLRVGAILPSADPEALQGFVTDVETTFHKHAQWHGMSTPELLCDMFAYPSHGSGDGALL